MTTRPSPRPPRSTIRSRVYLGRIRALTILNLVLVVATSGCADRRNAGAQVDDTARQKALESLHTGVDSDDLTVRTSAIDALVRLEYRVDLSDFNDTDTIPGDVPAEMWPVAARAAAMQGRQAEVDAWLDVWFTGLSDDSLNVRLDCARSLAHVGDAVTLDDEQRSQLATLAGDAESPNDELRAYLAWATAYAADDAMRVSLAKLLQSPNAQPVAAEALVALSLRRSPGDETIPGNISGNSVTDELVRLAYTDAGAGPDNSIAETYQSAAAGTRDEQLLLAQLLSVRGDASDLTLLEALGRADAPEVRLAAARAVCQIDRRVPRQLTRLDWAVIAAYALGMLAIGWHFARRSSTSDDYLLGGRQMKSGAVGLSLFATLLSTITYLSTPGEMIRNGPMMLCQVASYPLIILIIGWGLIPFLRRIQITSAYELLEDRFGLGVRMLGSTFFLMLRLLWMSVIIYATTDKVLVPLLGIDPSYTPLVGAILGVITIVYTTMGGLQAVVWTDVVQTGVLFFGAILSVVVISFSLGGVGEWWPREWAPSWQPFSWFDPQERISFFGITLAVITWQVCTNGSDQMAIQRYLSCSSDAAARRAQWTAMAADAAVALLLGTLGFALFAFFTQNPHLLPGGATVRANADQLLPRFVVIGLPEGVSGLVVAGLLAAAMSSLSSGVNSSSSVITVDFIERFSRKRFTDRAQVRVARVVSAVVGVVVVSLSMFLARGGFGNLFEIAYKVVNFFTAPLFGLFFMAFFVRWATTLGTFAGAVAGLAVCFGINYWEALTDAPRVIGFIWATPLSLISQIIVGCVVSAVERAVQRSASQS